MNITPKDLQPIKRIIIGENSFTDTKFLFWFADNCPLFIGNGAYPIIWLEYHFQNSKWLKVVEGNIAYSPDVDVKIDPLRRSTEIQVRGEVIIKCRMIDMKQCLVEELNLRHVGINIILEGNLLYVANQPIKDLHSNSSIAISESPR